MAVTGALTGTLTGTLTGGLFDDDDELRLILDLHCPLFDPHSVSSSFRSLSTFRNKSVRFNGPLSVSTNDMSMVCFCMSNGILVWVWVWAAGDQLES